MRRLEGRVAIVTGGGSGIGRATAIRLAAEGARVVVCGRRAEPLGETAAGAPEGGGEIAAERADVTVEAECAALVARTLERFGTLDVLVNNAGQIQRNLAAAEIDMADWRRILDANLTSAWLVSRAALPHLVESKGAIVNVASSLALVAVPGTPAYQAAKAGLLGLNRSMAVDYAPGVRVNAVCPGLVVTPISYVDRPDFDDHLEAFEAAHPLKRAGRPEDIAAAVAFLASPDAAWMTGTHITVDGGYTLT